MIAIVLVLGILILVYFLATKPFSYWRNKNVPTGKVTPIFGDNLRLIMGKESYSGMFQRTYNTLKDVRYLGVYQFSTPHLMIKSPKLIKQVCVKDFDHFQNHRVFLPNGVDELWSKNLVSLTGQSWKNMRSTVSPTFTSSKMKSMFVLICHKANHFVEHFLKKNEGIIELHFKEESSRYANDVIASAAFGIEVDSLEDRRNEFFLMGREFFGPPLFGPNVISFFVNLVKETIKIRQEQNIDRPDVLGLLLNARKEQHGHQSKEEMKETSFAVVEEHLEANNDKRILTDMDITAQIFVFFFGGFETVSSVMCFMAYELAVNPDIQQKLFEEIQENSTAGPPSYETVMNITYMDMVVSESLRRWPISVGTDRIVTKPYTIEPELPNEKPVHLEVGTNIMIPIVGLHYDPKYYENPKKFDPERFSTENRKNIDPYTYLPFGIGPRNCIGSRFAILETKTIFFYLLTKFELVPTEKTQIPLKMSRSSFNLVPEKGFLFGLKRRS